MKHVFSLADASEFGWPGIKGRSYSEKSDFDRASVARFWVTDRHGKVYNEVSDRIYLVLNGSGWFEIDGARHDVSKDDVVMVPRMTHYDYGGDLELFLVHAPAYERERDHDLEGLQE